MTVPLIVCSGQSTKPKITDLIFVVVTYPPSVGSAGQPKVSDAKLAVLHRIGVVAKRGHPPILI